SESSCGEFRTETGAPAFCVAIRASQFSFLSFTNGSFDSAAARGYIPLPVLGGTIRFKGDNSCAIHLSFPPTVCRRSPPAPRHFCGGPMQWRNGRNRTTH